ncbi:hypothetical protein CRG98_026007 [Punica granatum]|uniref:P-type ATPase A domain-containing protein n=1 Tax=Punica granatum TaxID=22663 RepID=A0A2I0JBC8_PUNGR|nr:hypothetical protein CRG98_026007 [Punica granatum]
MAIALANGDGKPPDWQDFVGIMCLLVINSTISFIEENNAGNAAAALMANLAPKTKVLRDGKWSEREAAVLVPGDIISIKLGDIIPADARLLEGDPLKVDQSALTGESLPARAGIREVHFFPFNPVDKRTALTYIESNGTWHRASKGAPEQILNLCNAREDMRKKEVPEKTKESSGAPWQFVGLLSLFDPPRHDSAETIRRALNLGVNVKMITGN